METRHIRTAKYPDAKAVIDAWRDGNDNLEEIGI